MEVDGVTGAVATQWDFFISYTATDIEWAEWIAWQLESVGYRVLFQAWDFVAGSHWTRQMQEGILSSERTIAVLSHGYLDSVYGNEEWQAAYRADPNGFRRKLVPIRVEDCERAGLLGSVVSFDLYDHSEEGARQYLLQQIKSTRDGRAKPSQAPIFPQRADLLVGTTREPNPARQRLSHPPGFPGSAQFQVHPLDQEHALRIPVSGARSADHLTCSGAPELPDSASLPRPAPSSRTRDDAQWPAPAAGWPITAGSKAPWTSGNEDPASVSQPTMASDFAFSFLRTVARIIDLFLSLIYTIIMIYPVALLLYPFALLVQDPNNGAFSTIGAAIAGILGITLPELLMTRFFGATPGKFLMGLRVVSCDPQRKLTVGVILMRMLIHDRSRSAMVI
ncbi:MULTISPECIES: TIR domain-containing protein [unclassified Frankia]|uniref:TIR domain-containing protein n=1 Tax=unclassified Frankia TaxID=2632575 RepID=UPI001EF4257B|nr:MULTISPECIES: TIR domain-containing protein [unclassified Frankia]